MLKEPPIAVVCCCCCSSLFFLLGDICESFWWPLLLVLLLLLAAVLLSFPPLAPEFISASFPRRRRKKLCAEEPCDRKPPSREMERGLLVREDAALRGLRLPCGLLVGNMRLLLLPVVGYKRCEELWPGDWRRRGVFDCDDTRDERCVDEPVLDGGRSRKSSRAESRWKESSAPAPSPLLPLAVLTSRYVMALYHTSCLCVVAAVKRIVRDGVTMSRLCWLRPGGYGLVSSITRMSSIGRLFTQLFDPPDCGSRVLQ